MKKTYKLLSIAFISIMMLLFVSCDGLFGSNKANTELYHLTFSSNIELTPEQKQQIKATYAYGVNSPTVVEGTRDSDEIEALRSAGATDDVIAKAGVRQDDGSYYFFEQDPMFIEAPKVQYYTFAGFYYKGTDNIAYKPIVDHESGFLYRWNMNDKDVELEARYQKINYTISFNYVADDEANPNTGITSYCPLDDGEIILEDATTSNPNKTFIRWEYQDMSVDSPDAPWIEIKDGKLPADYELDYMRISAVFDNAKYRISFAFEKYIDPETPRVKLTFDEVISSLSVHSNLATIDGVPEPCEMGSLGTPVNENSVILIDSVDGWANIFFTLNSNYSLWYFELNGERNENINASYMEDPYININQGDLRSDSVITFVISD